MISAAIIVVTLAVAASLGSWLFSQWIGARQRSTTAVLAVGGTGAVLLLGAAAFAIIVAPTWWKSFVPKAETPPIPPVNATPNVTTPMPSPAAQMTALMSDWPATKCVSSLRTSATAADWFIDNECDRMIAVVFAWCGQAEGVCGRNAPTTQSWRYEPAGIVMASMTQRPSRQRLGSDGPLIAATYALKVEGDARRIRYLACYVTSTEVLTLLNAPDESVSDAQLADRLASALDADACYGRVARWSRTGQRQGASPDVLLREGAARD